MSIIIKNGLIVSSDKIEKNDIKIEVDKIVEIGTIFVREEDTVIDATGKYIFPGAIDVHTHLDLDVGSTVTADNFVTGTKAAIAGGTTTIVDFATQTKGHSLMEAVSQWQQKADKGAFCDYGFHMAMVDWNDEIKKEMKKMVDIGIPSFKLYMAYKNTLQVDDATIFEALQESKKIGAIIGFHCENGDLVEAMTKQLLENGETAPYYHPISRPDTVEEEAIFRLSEIATLAKSPIWVVHLSTEKGLEVIKQMRKLGVDIVTETCPQYLMLDDSRYGNKGDTSFEGAKYVMSPPLRKISDVNSLWKGLKEEQIDIISTDHCSFNFKGQKDIGKNDFSKIPNGGPGLEHRLILIYTYGVLENKITLNEMVKLLAENPSKIFGLANKGSVSVGKDADIVIFDPKSEGEITAKNQYQNVDYTPYEGLKTKGKVDRVFLRGEQIFSNGKFVNDKPLGQFQKRVAYKPK